MLPDIEPCPMIPRKVGFDTLLVLVISTLILRKISKTSLEGLILRKFS